MFIILLKQDKMSDHEVLGWIGSLMFAFCAAPQAWKCFKEKKAEGISSLYIIMWFIGLVCMIIYVWPTQDKPLLSNYLLNLGFLLIIARFRFFPKIT